MPYLRGAFTGAGLMCLILDRPGLALVLSGIALTLWVLAPEPPQ